MSEWVDLPRDARPRDWSKQVCEKSVTGLERVEHCLCARVCLVVLNPATPDELDLATLHQLAHALARLIRRSLPPKREEARLCPHEGAVGVLP
jgi:hypothetical protein